MVLAENRLQLHDIQGKEDPVAQGKLEGKGFNELTYGTWNPHQNCQQYATGKFLSEAHILGSTNPQYDKRLFMELP